MFTQRRSALRAIIFAVRNLLDGFGNQLVCLLFRPQRDALAQQLPVGRPQFDPVRPLLLLKSRNRVRALFRWQVCISVLQLFAQLADEDVAASSARKTLL